MSERESDNWISVGYRTPPLPFTIPALNAPLSYFPRKHSLACWGKISRCYKSKKKKRGFSYCRSLEQYLDSVAHIFTKPAFSLLSHSYVSKHHYLRNISVLICLIRTKSTRNIQPFFKLDIMVVLYKPKVIMKVLPEHNNQVSTTDAKELDSIFSLDLSTVPFWCQRTKPAQGITFILMLIMQYLYQQRPIVSLLTQLYFTDTVIHISMF